MVFSALICALSGFHAANNTTADAVPRAFGSASPTAAFDAPGQHGVSLDAPANLKVPHDEMNATHAYVVVKTAHEIAERTCTPLRP